MGLLFPKPRPEKLEKADRLRTRVSIDEKESKKVRERSGGRCEVEVVSGRWSVPHATGVYRSRCKRRANQVHHMIGGIGVRGRGESAKRIRKQHTCAECHSDIGNKVLVRIGGVVPHFTDTYSRVK